MFTLVAIHFRLGSVGADVEETMETNQESLLDALDIQDEENGNEAEV